jgi:hypothetical protein
LSIFCTRGFAKHLMINAFYSIFQQSPNVTKV